MPTVPPARLLLAALLSLPPAASALELRAVEVHGLADEEMRDNVSDALGLQRLNPNRRSTLSEGRLSYLLRQAPGEARAALEPFGYYDADVRTEVLREGDAVTVRLTIDAGEPVTVHGRALALEGPGETDPVLARRLQRFRPREGQVFHHGHYEDSKAGMDVALLQRGYFDADLLRHEVRVTRAEHRADIDLAWRTGKRYALGEASYRGHPFRPGLLEKLTPWTPGDPFDQQQLRDLQNSLSELDYFAAIDIQAQPEQAEGDQVPVDVVLAPAKRSVYNAGIRYGTDSGLGLTGGIDRRWLNDRGHKLRTQANLAQRKKDITAQYRIPAFAWLNGWYGLSASLREERTDDTYNQLAELIGSRSGKLGEWDLVAALHWRRERYQDATTDFEYRYSTLVYPSLLAQWKRSDDVLYPRRALGLTVELLGGSTSVGSDIDFLQLRAEGRWIHAFGRRNRLLLRAEAGTTLSQDYDDFPPSLRFYAGGDRSVRGYSYQEIGPSLVGSDGERHVVGGKHLLVGSAEFERMFNRTWGAAVFVDAGDAFDLYQDITLQPALGLGLRWRSPVGPVRVDVAHGFGDDAGATLRIHLNIGPDL